MKYNVIEDVSETLTNHGDHDYTPEQTAENRRLWVAALRSGDYERNRQELRFENRFSALGVACDISGLGKWVVRHKFWTLYRYETAEGEIRLIRSALPSTVRDWLGLNDLIGGYFHDDQQIEDMQSLLEDCENDKTFAEIADIIESEPEELVYEPDA